MKRTSKHKSELNKVTPMKTALEMLKDQYSELTIKTHKGTIFQTKGDRYFIDFAGNISYMTKDGVKKVHV